MNSKVMKKTLITALLLIVTLIGHAQWQPAGNKIKTPGLKKSTLMIPYPNIPVLWWFVTVGSASTAYGTTP